MSTQPIHPTQPERILIIKPSSLGDVVTAMPVLRGLRRTFPRAHIAWLISNACAPLIESDSDLNEIIIFERKKLGQAWRSIESAKTLAGLCHRLAKGKFDWVIDLQGLFRSGFFTFASGAHRRIGFADSREAANLFYTETVAVTPAHTVDRNIAIVRPLGVDAKPQDMNLQIADQARQFADDFGRQHSLPRKGYLVCVPPTRWVTKRYPVRHWRTVVSALASKLPLAILGSKDPAEISLCAQVADGMGPNVLNLAGQTNIPQLVAIIERSAGVICSDSAAKFIAPAVGVDAVAIIGPTRVELTGPYLRGQAVVANIACQGCLRKRCPHITCMELIPPREVIAAAERMINTTIAKSKDRV